jgi:hypothetical protein
MISLHTSRDLLRLCRRIYYDKSFAEEYGRVPVERLCAVAGVPVEAFNKLVIRGLSSGYFSYGLGWDGPGAKKVHVLEKLLPFLQKIASKQGRFVRIRGQGYIWHDDTLAAFGQTPALEALGARNKNGSLKKKAKEPCQPEPMAASMSGAGPNLNRHAIHSLTPITRLPPARTARIAEQELSGFQVSPTLHARCQMALELCRATQMRSWNKRLARTMQGKPFQGSKLRTLKAGPEKQQLSRLRKQNRKELVL